MSTFLFKSPAINQPKPDVTQQVDDVPSYGGFSSPLLMDLLSNTGNDTPRVISTYFTAQDYDLHYSESIGWITPRLNAGTYNGSWSATVYLLIVAAAPLNVIPKVKAALFRWGNDDTKKEQIGTTILSAEITTTATAYTFTFTSSQSVTIAKGERIYIELWNEIRDSQDDTGANLTTRVRYNSSTTQSGITIPGTQSIASLSGPPGRMIIT